ncbi:MAG: DnaJ domain-containing protein [Myxococcota bacterium]|nr:DnaJ domain-containing protein [Myxococcota bacterium]
MAAFHLLRLLLAGLVAWVLWRGLKKAGLWPQVLGGDASSPRRKESEKGPQLFAVEDNPYEVLGLTQDASAEQVEEAFERLSAQNAPEAVAEMSPEVRATAKRMTEKIQLAYKQLTSPESPSGDT